MDVALFVATAAGARYWMGAASTKNNNKNNNRSSQQQQQLTVDLIRQQGAMTSAAIIEHYQHSPLFTRLAQYEGDLTVRRDQEDASKLEIGIAYAQSKGVIDPHFVPEPYVQIDVLNQQPDDVAKLILQQVQQTNNNSNNNNKSTGSVIVLVGLSGTGKGTTVTQLRQHLQEQGQTVTTWSNGNVFRSVTLLAAIWCEQNNVRDDGVFDADQALTKENVALFMSMLSLEKHPVTGLYDICLNGLGLQQVYVSDIENTELKAPKVSKNIPTVAQFTQGEVILFAAQAVRIMGQDGITVLLEGREQTVNHVRTPHRFALTLSDESLIGKRRAAQRLMAQALDDLNNNNNNKSSSSGDDDVICLLDAALETMVLGIS